MSLPEIDLSALTTADHTAHHVAIHDLLNRLLTDAAVGDVLTKLAAGSALATVGPAQAGHIYNNQVVTVSHTVAGPLVINCTAQTRVVLVTASANIVGLTVNNLALLGDGYAEVRIRIQAAAGITVAATPTNIEVAMGTVPTTMATGAVAYIEVGRVGP